VSGLNRVIQDARHYVVIIVVFGITGSIAVALSRVLLDGVIGLDGSLWAGPWSYRVTYLLLIPPSYSATLVLVGRLFGKREFFTRRVLRMWGFLLPFRTGGTPTRDPAERRRDR
jgi:hypothetical protein